ncbi:hypothetical protein LZ31DRAFT_178021 [Colletotrichum somersetense]|nr:hypothetical protein LZ31DRAFT_178021 [Colletotrichum somersetense]
MREQGHTHIKRVEPQKPRALEDQTRRPPKCPVVGPEHPTLSLADGACGQAARGPGPHQSPIQ